MSREHLLSSIAYTIEHFGSASPTQSGIALFDALGYPTVRKMPLQTTTSAHFRELFEVDRVGFNAEKALCDSWTYVDLVFQITADDLSGARNLFTTDQVDNTRIESYLVFVIALSPGTYTRTQLSTITRQVNRVFPMPVLILFRIDQTLTLAVIDRRMHRKDASRDVLEKVTLIKDITEQSPHRAHLEILADLSLPELRHRHAVTNFVELHRAWRATLDVSELNKQFYREISDWYFWAQSQVVFPTENEIPADSRTQINLIRLLARMMFVWFMRERGLIPQEFFTLKDVSTLIDLKLPSSYYKAVLQNLFFATLNQEMDPALRRFRDPEGYPNVDYLNHGRYRYQAMFRDPNAALSLFHGIPFLNGGLFECLDGRVTLPDGKHRHIRIDGFSDRDDNEISVPNHLFFSAEREVDLSAILGGTQFSREKVRGLIDILNRYKFTVTENTPIEEEIALDPELLGRVFENLLASFNPETSDTARRQTGSFYTPREIVDYMTDSALISHLVGRVATPETHGEFRESLQAILDYSASDVVVAPETAERLIRAIEEVRIIDVACGSGAFPMGVLNKLVLLLQHLDPHNEQWKARQLANAERIEDAAAQESARTQILASFEHNEMDYGRKLFLIKNAIYGADIQPIAIHIAKLRFFISLLVDQRIDPARPNLGVQALPNLESNFVAADTLRTPHLEDRQGELRFEDPETLHLERELRKIRERHFLARDRHTKDHLRTRDHEVREELRKHLEERLHSNSQTLRTVVEWNPYDQNAAATWFDPALMFGLKQSDLFDIVLGNPPYRQIQQLSAEQKAAYSAEGFKSYAGMGDIYLLFYERGLSLLRSGGYLSYISSNKWMRAAYGEAFRRFLGEKATIHELIDFGDHQFFDNATTYVNIILLQNLRPVPAHSPRVLDLSRGYAKSRTLRENLEAASDFQPMFEPTSYVIARPAEARLKEKIERAGVPLSQWDVRINRGILTGLNEAFIIDGAKRAELIAADPKSEEIIVPLVRGKDIKRYRVDWKDLWLINSHNGLKKKGLPRVNVVKKYPAVYEHLKQFRPALEKRQDQGDHWTNLRSCAYLDDLRSRKVIYSEVVFDSAFFLDQKGLYPEATAFYLISPDQDYLVGLLNSAVSTAAFRHFYMGGDLRGQTFRYKKEFLLRLPVPPIPSAAVAKLVGTMVHEIQELKNAGDSTVEKERLMEAISMVLHRMTIDDLSVLAPEVELTQIELERATSLIERSV